MMLADGEIREVGTSLVQYFIMPTFPLHRCQHTLLISRQIDSVEISLTISPLTNLVHQSIRNDVVLVHYSAFVVNNALLDDRRLELSCLGSQ